MLSFMSVSKETQRVHNKGHVAVTVCSPPPFLAYAPHCFHSPVGESLYVMTVSGLAGVHPDIRGDVITASDRCPAGTGAIYL